MAANWRKTRKDKREDIRERDIVGLKYFDQLAPLLAHLEKLKQQDA